MLKQKFGKKNNNTVDFDTATEIRLCCGIFRLTNLVQYLLYCLK